MCERLRNCQHVNVRVRACGCACACVFTFANRAIMSLWNRPQTHDDNYIIPIPSQGHERCQGDQQNRASSHGMHEAGRKCLAHPPDFHGSESRHPLHALTLSLSRSRTPFLSSDVLQGPLILLAGICSAYSMLAECLIQI